MSALADLVYVGERLDIDGFATVKASPYYTVNLSGTYRVTRDLSLFTRIENLFDKDYEDPKGFGTKGISAYAGIRVSM
jgi:vitamin B12 transporter